MCSINGIRSVNSKIPVWLRRNGWKKSNISSIEGIFIGILLSVDSNDKKYSSGIAQILYKIWKRWLHYPESDIY
jgi:hypothetical protein